jgi:hypothetical protein
VRPDVAKKGADDQIGHQASALAGAAEDMARTSTGHAGRAARVVATVCIFVA